VKELLISRFPTELLRAPASHGLLLPTRRSRVNFGTDEVIGGG